MRTHRPDTIEVDSKRRTVLVLSVFVLLGCETNDFSRTDLFVFDADERLFTAHAFMNVGGFDLEYEDSMHPIRTAVRERLKETLPPAYQDSFRGYYQSHDHYAGYYGTYAFALSGAPKFDLDFHSETSDEWAVDVIQALPGLDQRLRQFYRRAAIGELWAEYGPQIQELHDRYRPHAATALDHLESYFRVEDFPIGGRHEKIITAFSPLLSHYVSFTVRLNGNVYLVMSPQPDEPSPSSYYHEAAHHIVGPIVDKHLNEIQQSSDLLPLALERLGGNYDEWAKGVFEESLIRTIDAILTGRLLDSADEEVQRWLEGEYKMGFILCFYFYEELPAYEASGASMEEYLASLAARIDVARETRRWMTFWSAQNE